jgi:hypothetical protein
VGLFATQSSATAYSANFDSAVALNAAGLMNGLTATDVAQIVNWDLHLPPPPPPISAANTIFAAGTDFGDASAVKVFDSHTGLVQSTFNPYGTNFQGGVRVAVGDVNHDGVTDTVTAPGPGGGPLVNVYSGKDNSLLVSFNAYDPAFSGGVYVAAGDVNGDGFADIITAPDAGGGPLVKVFSGKAILAGTANPDQALLLPGFNAYDPSFLGGVRVGVGDINGDASADIITGPGAGGGPLVNVFSGKDGSLLRSFNAYDVKFLGGIYVAAGDFNGDGHTDILTGPGVGGGSLVQAFDGQTGTLLVSFNAFPPPSSPSGSSSIGILPANPGSGGVPTAPSGVRVAAVDRTGDGRSDILAAQGPGTLPVLVIFDAVTLTELDDIFAFDPNFMGGVFVGG